MRLARSGMQLERVEVKEMGGVRWRDEVEDVRLSRAQPAEPDSALKL